MEKSEALLAEVRKETDEQVKKSRVRTNVLENLLRRREKHAASIEKSRMEISRLDKLIAAERKRLEEIKLTQVAQICQKKE
ncbi:MAG: hypothetical protein LIO69_00165 [Oscillospiraceae bacterium]|nr:hypothetical protein [Oscillospiraceae bacterium]